MSELWTKLHWQLPDGQTTGDIGDTPRTCTRDVRFGKITVILNIYSPCRPIVAVAPLRRPQLICFASRSSTKLTPMLDPIF